MRCSRLVIAVLSVLMIAPGSVIADFLAPFEGPPTGEAVTSRGWILIDSNRDPEGQIKYLVFFWTDTGERVIQADVPAGLNISEVLGRPAMITAEIFMTPTRPDHEYSYPALRIKSVTLQP